MHRIVAAVTLILAMLIPATAVAQKDNSISISRDSGVDILNAAIAANSNNGTALVVWREDDRDAGIGQIYSSLVKLKGNGKAKAKKPKLLVKDAGSFNQLSLAYNPRNNTYLLGFERVRPGKSPLQAIIVQRLSAAGKKIGPENIVTTRFGNYRYSLLHFVESSDRPGGEFIIFWEAFAGSKEDAGIWFTRLDATGSPIGGDNANIKVADNEDPKNVVRGNLLPSDVLENTDGSFWLSFIANSEGDFSNDFFLLKLSPAGKQQAYIYIESPNAYDPSLAWLSKSRFAAFWVQPPSGVVQTMNDTPARKIKKAVSPLPDFGVSRGTLLSLPSGGALAFVRNNASGHIEVVEISSKGKIGNQSEVIYPFISHNGFQFRSALLSSKGTSAAIVLFKTASDSDLRAIAYTIEN